MASSFVAGLIILLFNSIRIQAEICGEIMKTSSGYLSPPATDGVYHSNLFCRWEIANDQNTSIGISVTDFAVEDSDGCRWDYLEIRDGEDNSSNSIGRFCGFNEVYYLSHSSSVFIYFVTDNFHNERGFQLKYYNTGNSDMSQCNSIIRSEGYITSPGYPNSYSSSTKCIYRIIAPASYRIELSFLHMSVSDSSCLFDRLDVYDGPTSYFSKLGTLCGEEIPDKISTTGSQMLLVFTSDYIVNEKGFLAEVKFKSDFEGPTHTQIKNESCNIWLENSMNGIVRSPGYPTAYDNNIDCSITIIAPVADHQIMLQFTQMEVEDSSNCTFDRVSLFLDSYSDVPEVQLCGLATPEERFYSKEGYMKIQFTSDSLITWSGFSAVFEIIPRQVCFPRCHNNSVCVKDGKNYSCVSGQKCLTNLCNNGYCVKKGLAEVKCFCNEGYEGLFCTERKQIISKVNEKLKFTKTPFDQSIDKGKRVLLECQVNDASAEYMWFHEDYLLQTDKDVVTIHPGGVLDIMFGEKLEGLYKCLATTVTDFLEYEFRLTLAEPCNLSIQSPPLDTVIEEASVVLMTCYSQNDVNVTWKKDNITIVDNAKFKTLSDGQYLAISHVVPSDAGEYTCSVRNKEGCEVHRTAELTVIPASGFNAHCARDVLVHNPLMRMSGRITNGYTVDSSRSAPWHAILRMKSQGKTFCGASLISKSWLITAAHCIRHFHIEFKEEFTADKVDIYLGTVSCSGENGTKFSIKSYVVHPNFGKRSVYDNDIALIELDREVTFNDEKQPVCLQPSSVINANYLTHKLGRKIGRVVGCGQYSEFRKTSPDYLREVYVPYVNREDCAAVNIGHGNFTDSMFCAGYSRSNMGDACFGDSGGSLTMRLSDNHPWVLVGIVSWGIGCDRADHYGYYTHVAVFEDWIQNYTAPDRRK